MKRTASVFVIAVVALASVWAKPGGSTVVGAQFGIGYTVIDLPTALDWNSDYFDDWSQLFGGIRLQGTFATFGNARVGAEVGYSHLYYYYVTVPYVPSDLVYEKDVWVWSASALAALDLSEQFELQAAAGLYGFDNGVVFGLRGAALYRVPLGAQAALPIGGSADVIFGDGTPIAVALAVGFEYRP